MTGAMSACLESWQANLKTHAQEIRSSIPALEAAKKAAEEALAEAKAKFEEVDPSERPADRPTDLSATLDLREEAPETPETLQLALREAQQALTAACQELDFAQAELASCDANVGWKPPEVEVDPEIAAAIEAAKAEAEAAKAAQAKARAKSKPKPDEPKEEPLPEQPIVDFAIEALAKGYLELKQMATSTIERYNTSTREAEEERQREQERRRRQRKAAAQAAKDANRRPKGPPPEPIDLTAADFEPSMEESGSLPPRCSQFPCAPPLSSSPRPATPRRCPRCRWSRRCRRPTR
ncbi:unnamed protein product [Effrenium voratum]|uniref:Uncharacterized protein n=1 Tax=Effrenium voratum TaxID=2562239 RepID=A0AA36J5N4_9DINO|nr:unnamed protein product [Effrenium voratum]